MRRRKRHQPMPNATHQAHVPASQTSPSTRRMLRGCRVAANDEEVAAEPRLFETESDGEEPVEVPGLAASTAPGSEDNDAPVGLLSKPSAGSPGGRTITAASEKGIAPGMT